MLVLNVDHLMKTSGVQFGTSGARGLVSAMSDDICYAYTVAFLQHLRGSGQLMNGTAIALAGDLRASTPAIMRAIGAAIYDQGHSVINCGSLPSPAVALYGMSNGIPSIMVTGSHIPDDRNGIKFNTAKGEILKTDEVGIRRQEVQVEAKRFDGEGFFYASETYQLPDININARTLYAKRYISFFPENCLAEKNIGLYQHSTVGRDIFNTILENLGATVTTLGYSDIFTPVDTEAIRQEDIDLAKQWSDEYQFDAIISADGDADRPLISDEHGQWLRGDVAGILCARYLQADIIVTPVSSNSAAEESGYFKEVRRTRIGSPYVIAEMQQAINNDGSATVVGYEANGGFLTGVDIRIDSGTMSALPTRDAILVPLTILMLSIGENKTISKLIADLPPRFTASDRIKEFPTTQSQAIIAGLQSSEAIEELVGQYFGKVKTINKTDGLRITFENNDVMHLRPSGNAPEFRCYNESSSEERVNKMNKLCMKIVSDWKG